MPRKKHVSSQDFLPRSILTRIFSEQAAVACSLKIRGIKLTDKKIDIDANMNKEFKKS